MTQTAEIIIHCDEIGCDNAFIIEDPDQNYYTFSTDAGTVEDEGWHIVGSYGIHLYGDKVITRDRHICPDCYSGSFYEKEDLYNNHIDDKIKASKEGV